MVHMRSRYGRGMQRSVTSRDRYRRKVERMPGVRTVRRPTDGTVPAFDLAYVRQGPTTPTPTVIIPGGPGLGSVLPYRDIRRRAAGLGLDVLMVEHRGVGLSRTDTNGDDLPAAAMTVRAAVEDIVAALDAEGTEQAIVYGCSYGSYLAQALGAWFPNRVAAMILDSAMDGADQFREVRDNARDLLWEGNSPATATAARLLREVVESGQAEIAEASEVARITYEFAGIETLERLLHAFRARTATRTWTRLARLGANDTDRIVPYVMEFDLVGHIAFGELNYAGDPDGGPFDTNPRFQELGERFGRFHAEPLTLAGYRAGFTWPVVVLCGERDLRTPPVGARRIADSVAQGSLIEIADTGHSALDTHARVALAAIAAVVDGSYIALHEQSAELAALPKLGTSRHIGTLIKAGIRAESTLGRFAFWR